MSSFACVSKLEKSFQTSSSSEISVWSRRVSFSSRIYWSFSSGVCSESWSGGVSMISWPAFILVHFWTLFLPYSKTSFNIFSLNCVTGHARSSFVQGNFEYLIFPKFDKPVFKLSKITLSCTNVLWILFSISYELITFALNSFSKGSLRSFSTMSNI